MREVCYHCGKTENKYHYGHDFLSVAAALILGYEAYDMLTDDDFDLDF